MQTLHRCSFLSLGLVSGCFSTVLPTESHDGAPSGDGVAGHAYGVYEAEAVPPAVENAGCGAPAPDDGGTGGTDVATSDDAPSESVALDATAATVTGPTGAAPRKGDALKVELHLKNAATHASKARLTVLVDSARFSDFIDVPLGSVDVMVASGESDVTISGGPFLSDATKQKEYALGRGDYTLSVRVERDGEEPTLDDRLDGAAFTLAASDALFGAVVYDQRYFDEIQGFSGTPEEYLDRVYSRPNQVFTPSNVADPDGAGTFQSFPGGFEQMLGVRQLFRLFPGFPGESVTEQGWCEDVGAYAAQVLGLQTGWTTAGTDPTHHGFDFALGLTPDMGGGVNCGWLDVEVGSLIDRDADRQEIVLIHETGHMFGAPHCDDVGNGEGGSLQGYVMCSGELHANYPQQFVWHSTSRAAMYNHWD
jgi:hypothetical protein